MHSKNLRRLLVGAVVCMFFAGLIYYYNNFRIPDVSRDTENEVRKELDENAMPRQKVAIIASEEGISKYTELTGKIIDEKVRYVEIPARFVVRGVVTDIDKIKGKITKEDLRYGEQIVSDSLSADKKWYGEFQRLKEYEVSSIVADEVKTGNIIDIIVNYGDGSYDVVIPKIKVIKLISSKKPEANRMQEGEPKTGESQHGEEAYSTSKLAAEYTLIIAVDEEQYRDMELAGGLGKLETRLYIDENQPPSKKTFNYALAVNRLKTSSNYNGTAGDMKR